MRASDLPLQGARLHLFADWFPGHTFSAAVRPRDYRCWAERARWADSGQTSSAGCQSVGNGLTSCRGRFHVEIEEYRPDFQGSQPKRRFASKVDGTWVLKANRFREEATGAYPPSVKRGMPLLSGPSASQDVGTGPPVPPHGQRTRILAFDGSEGTFLALAVDPATSTSGSQVRLQVRIL